MKLGSLAASIGIFAFGCAGTVNVVEPGQKQASPVSPWIEKVTTSRGLEKRVRVDSVFLSDRGGLNLIQANLVNTKRSSQDFMYRLQWFDTEGIEVYDPSASWTRRTIEGKERLEILSVAPSPAAVDWRLSIREWDR